MIGKEAKSSGREEGKYARIKVRNLLAFGDILFWEAGSAHSHQPNMHMCIYFRGVTRNSFRGAFKATDPLLISTRVGAKC